MIQREVQRNPIHYSIFKNRKINRPLSRFIMLSLTKLSEMKHTKISIRNI